MARLATVVTNNYKPFRARCSDNLQRALTLHIADVVVSDRAMMSGSPFAGHVGFTVQAKVVALACSYHTFLQRRFAKFTLVPPSEYVAQDNPSTEDGRTRGAQGESATPSQPARRLAAEPRSDRARVRCHRSGRGPSASEPPCQATRDTLGLGVLRQLGGALDNRPDVGIHDRERRPASVGLRCP